MATALYTLCVVCLLFMYLHCMVCYQPYTVVFVFYGGEIPAMPLCWLTSAVRRFVGYFILLVRVLLLVLLLNMLYICLICILFNISIIVQIV